MTATTNATAQQASAGAAAHFYLQDSRSNTGDNLMFWAADGGYTSNLARAELFTEDRAFGQNDSRPTDVPWPQSYLDQRSRRVVDMQYLKATDITQPQYADCTEYLLQQPGYNGNDIYFAAKNGGTTTDLSQARVFSPEELLSGPVQNLRAIPWPRSYLEEKSRPAVDVHKVALKEALRGIPRQVKRERKHVERFRCEGCGIFMTALAYYTTACRCGCENRP